MKKNVKKYISIVLFSIWCAVSGAMLFLVSADENNIIKTIGGISLIIIILMILFRAENRDEN